MSVPATSVFVALPPESRIGDAPVRLLSLEANLEIKRASVRPKDRAMVPLLEATLRRRSS